jgi:hypothetical protein
MRRRRPVVDVVAVPVGLPAGLLDVDQVRQQIVAGSGSYPVGMCRRISADASSRYASTCERFAPERETAARAS